MDIWVTLGHIIVLLASALIVGGVFSRLGQSPLLGYILAGMFLGGPGSVHWVGSEHEIEALAELGVTLLLFSLGLEFSIQRMKSLGAKPLLGGLLQVVVTIVVGFMGAYAFKLAVVPALAFGMLIALSSTAVVLRILMERTELETAYGRNALAVLLVQDMAVVPLALIMTVAGKGGSLSSMLFDIGQLLVMALGLVAILFILSKLVVKSLGELTLQRNRELTIIFSLVAGLGSAWGAHHIGISPALGAFVAGMMLGSSEFATQIRADIASLRVILLTLFFGSAGMLADPMWLFEHWQLVLLVTVGITMAKTGVIWLVFKAFGYSHRVAVATGISLSQVGEFAFVLGSIGKLSGAVSDDMYALIVSATIVSFAISSFLVPLSSTIGCFVSRLWQSSSSNDEESTGEKTLPDILVIGYGPAGQIAARPFLDSDLNVLVLDLNHKSIALAREHGFSAEIGDATQPEVLEHIHLHECKAIIISIPHHECAMIIVDQLRHLAPHAQIYARSRYEIFYDEFRKRGVTVVGDEREVGKTMALGLSELMTGNKSSAALTSNERACAS